MEPPMNADVRRSKPEISRQDAKPAKKFNTRMRNMPLLPESPGSAATSDIAPVLESSFSYSLAFLALWRLFFDFYRRWSAADFEH